MKKEKIIGIRVKYRRDKSESRKNPNNEIMKALGGKKAQNKKGVDVLAVIRKIYQG